MHIAKAILWMTMNHCSLYIQLLIFIMCVVAAPHIDSAWEIQEYWSGLPFPSPGNLPNPGIKPMSPALAGRFFTSSATSLGFITMLTIHMVNYDRRTEELYAVLQFPVQWLLYGSHRVFWGPYLVSSSVHLLNFTLIKNNKILIQRGKCLFY